MLYALSYLCFIKKKKFIYHTTEIPNHLKQNPIGNFKFAIELNAKINEIKKSEFDNEISSIKSNLQKNEFFIEQGGKDTYSKYGMKELALQVQSIMKENNINHADIFIPSGTGTSAFYLQNYLCKKVYTFACVGDKNYLVKQFQDLSNLDKSYIKHPSIIEANKKYRFGKCYKEFYSLYKDMKSKIEFELLYDMPSLIAIKNNQNILENNIIYIHCGGTHGNESMEERYKYLLKT